MNKKLLFLAAFLALQTATAQTILRVDPAAQGLGNGASWADAYTNLHTALLNAQPGDAVWVKQGTYHTTDNNDRALNFQLKSGVKLLGGFAGNETNLDQRDWAAHPTVFDGDIGVAGDSTDNTYNLLYIEFPDAETEVNGITFKNAVANKFIGDFNPTTCGGAIFINGKDSIAYPLIKNCSFLSNTCNYFGGAVYVNANLSGSVAPRFHNCLFQSNRAAGGFGGAVYRNGSSWIEWPADFKDCIFDNNYAAGNGGAIFFGDAQRLDTLQIENCVFRGNVSSGLGGAFYTGGRSDGSLIIFNKCKFEENRGFIGGAFCFYADNNPIQYIEFDSCHFEKNRLKAVNPFSAPFSPDLQIYSGFFDYEVGDIIIKNCSFINQDTFSGDEISGWFRSVIITKSQFINTKTLLVGTANGSIEFSYNIYGPNSRGVSLYGNPQMQTTKIIGNIFYNNKKTLFNISSAYPSIIVGNIFAENKFWHSPASFSNPSSPSLIYNNIFYNNYNVNPSAPGHLIPFQNDSAFFYHNLIADLPNCDSIPSLFVCGPGNIFGLDPLLADTAAGDFHLLPCSPAINAGLNDFYLQNNLLTDLGGGPRILDGLADMGPYESPQLALSGPPAVRPACPGIASGAARFEVANACAPLSFQWTGDNGAGNDTAALAPGLYHFTLTDQQGKLLEHTLSVGEAPPPVWSGIVTPASCPACPDGAISVSIDGGFPPFSFLWSTGHTGELLENVPPGVYTLSITDGAGCGYADSLTLLAVGADEAQSPPGFRLFPNPAAETTQLQLTLPSPTDLRLRLADADGRTLRQWTLPAGADRLSLPLDDLNPGVYWLWVQGENGVWGGKLVRQ